ncbi:MAG TPA: glycerol-3-phosphate 1-O-acyltransferase PlsY [Bacillota bacterium]|nr:glycerol-3-phosphate 1-O-acyltransferase PlsY [Bacillota bacterium]
MCWGGVLFGHILASISKTDLKSKGSGNPGATNVFRVIGPIAGVLVLLGDVFKGIAAVKLGEWISGQPVYLPLYGLAAIIGHNWSVFHRFKGGKGIATTLGTVIILCPHALWIILPLFIIATIASSFVSFGSIMAAISFPFGIMILYPRQHYLLIYAVAATIMAIYRHIPNIRRILRGEEHKLFSMFPRKEK